MRQVTTSSETLLNRRAVALSMLPVPIVTWAVIDGIAPIPLLVLPLLLAPIIAVILGRNEDSQFDGAAAGALSLVLIWLTAIAWFPVVGPSLPEWVVADITYLSLVIGIPLAIGAVILAAALGAVLARMVKVGMALLSGEARVEIK